VALSQLDPAWGVTASVIFVMAVQGLSGVAKDLSKMSAKSAVKVLAPKEGGGLFRWVAILTGSKNAVKGFGFLLGAGLLAVAGFQAAIWAMAVVLTAILIGTFFFMPSGLPQGKKSAKFSQVFSKDRNINRLSLARMFLFGARDVWFVVGIPIYFYSVLSDGTAEGNRAAFFMIGTFMAVWIILYGLVQGLAPKILKAKDKSTDEVVWTAILWVALLTLIPLALTFAVWADLSGLVYIVVAGLMLFGFVFAVNSSVHSYLILAFTSEERVTMDVGFYYMSNAAGRLLGTLLSGVSYQIGGLPLCLFTAALMAAASTLAALRLRH
jgi:hypothetical protein